MGGSGSDDDVRVASSGPSSCTSHHAGSWTTKRLEPERSRKANKEYFYNNLVKRKQQQSTKSEYHSSIPTAVSGNSRGPFYVSQWKSQPATSKLPIYIFLGVTPTASFNNKYLYYKKSGEPPSTVVRKTIGRQGKMSIPSEFCSKSSALCSRLP